MSTGSNGESRAPSRGEIWLYDPDPVLGREQGNIRPGLILSNDDFNRTRRGLVVIVPMTRTQRNRELYPYHVEIDPEASGLQHLSVFMCEQVRSISIDRLRGSVPRGRINAATIEQLEARIRLLLDL